ncbi:MAG: hypothetical protein L6Q95_06065 [Planctomycetes bacterium]|nr:hypothetical protein [Planctomycetota bacterium]
MYRFLAVLTVALAVLATLLWGSKRGGSGGDGPSRARVEEREGVLVVRLSGPPRSKGRALGEALRGRIRAELSRALPDEGLREFAVKTCGEKLARFLPGACRLEIEGIAEGAGISFQEALFLDTRYEISAFGLVRGAADLPAEGAVGPGPEAACLLPSEAARDLVVVIHEDMDPPLALVARPGMAGGFLGARGDIAAAMRPARQEATPPLSGLVWTLLFRRILEEAPLDPREEGTGPFSVAMALPGRAAATLNLGGSGAAWFAAKGPHAMTTDEEAPPRRAAHIPHLSREASANARIAEAAALLLAGTPPSGLVRVSLRGGATGLLVVEGAEGRRTIPLGAR